jgi:hypothetical protein
MSVFWKPRRVELLSISRVRRATVENQGKKTAGVDGNKSLSPKARLELAGQLKANRHHTTPTWFTGVQEWENTLTAY